MATNLSDINFYSANTESRLLASMTRHKANGFYKSGSFVTEIVWNKMSYICPKKDGNSERFKNFKRGMFLYSLVRKDAKNFIANGNKVKLPKQRATIQYNETLPPARLRKNITATDLNHAYWRIAYNTGIITEKTYLKGLQNHLKEVRLSALSTLGKGKTYKIIKEGVLSEEKIVFGSNEELETLYKYIRYSCYNYMHELVELLGNDFVAYKTDCIYYFDNQKNRENVQNYLLKKNLTYKQMIE